MRASVSTVDILHNPAEKQRMVFLGACEDARSLAGAGMTAASTMWHHISVDAQARTTVNIPQRRSRSLAGGHPSGTDSNTQPTMGSGSNITSGPIDWDRASVGHQQD